ncbi:MAG TPA: hypothetical protein VHL34_17865, partial [Rhizomicrobium sp.]|nr:hypothetical protein [Rhizomicrobium sp.]
MKSKVIGALTVAIAAGISAPAWAAWDKITNLDVGYHADRDVASPNFGGPVERLQFTARGTDIQCKYVRARFDNGTTADLFSGRLRQNSAQSVDLPGTRRNIRALVTNCHGFQKGGSSIDVYADIGSYRDTWMKSPDWARVWARIFNWGTSAGSSFDNAV